MQWSSALLLASCTASSAAAAATHAATTAINGDPATETLHAPPPRGWRHTYEFVGDDHRILEFVPPADLPIAASERLRFESLARRGAFADADPIAVQDLIAEETRNRCRNLETRTTFAGHENGWPTEVRLHVCKRDNALRGSIEMIKVIAGNDWLYVTAIASVGDKGVAIEPQAAALRIAEWSRWLRAVEVRPAGDAAASVDAGASVEAGAADAGASGNAGANADPNADADAR